MRDSSPKIILFVFKESNTLFISVFAILFWETYLDEDSLEQINLPSDPGSLEESGSAEGSPGLSGSKPSHKFQFEVQYKESCTFWVTFVPKDVDRYFGNVKVIVDRNQFEETGSFSSIVQNFQNFSQPTFSLCLFSFQFIKFFLYRM